MKREEFNILDEWVFAEVKHNRDNYSRAKIIELIMKRAEELVNENDSLHLVSHQRELLLAYENYTSEMITGKTNDRTAKSLVNDFLDNNCS